MTIAFHNGNVQKNQPFPQSVINATTKAMDMNLVLTPFYGVKLSLTRKAG
ncbi:hypothetical protein LRP_185 [Ligilactobacillus ruminis]|nr:hypothetical protein LRP_185 [Ligilactobacillus ruminis]